MCSSDLVNAECSGADVVFTRAFGIDPQGNIVGAYMTKDALGVLHTHGFVATRRP